MSADDLRVYLEAHVRTLKAAVFQAAIILVYAHGGSQAAYVYWLGQL